MTAVGIARTHAVPGTHNLRDTGGYRGAAGPSRWGRLYRSDALHRLDATGQARLGDLGITTVIDLRGSDERAQSPSRLDAAVVRIHEVPIFDDTAATVQITADTTLVEVYDHIVDHRAEQVVAAIRLIATTPDDEAVLVHCTAGKDRTGVVVAFALRAAGVDRDEVVADYAKTADNLRGDWADGMLAAIVERGIEPSEAIVDLVTASPAPVIAALIDRVEHEHGSIAAYLQAAGLTDDELAQLIGALTD